MGIMVFNIRANTTQCMFLYRDFVVQESTQGWQWTPSDHDAHIVPGACRTVFECFEAIERWYSE